MTPVRFRELFFNDVSVDMIFSYTKLYRYRGKGDISFEITNEIIRLVLSTLLLNRCHKLPERKMH